MKYIWSTTLGCRDIWIRKSDFVTKTQFLWNMQYIFNLVRLLI